MGRTKRIITLSMAIILFVAVFCSLGYLAENTHHDCIGTGCPVCAQLEVAESTITGLGMAFVFVVTAIFLCVSIRICAVSYEAVCVKNTLVTLKVELLN